MNKQRQDEQQEKESLTDWLKGIGLVGIPLWIVLFILCCAGISKCQDRRNKSGPPPPLYRMEDVYQHRPTNNAATGTRKHLLPVQSEENKLIDKLSGEDYCDYSDYNDGLDGVHSYIDYNEVRDYFED